MIGTISPDWTQRPGLRQFAKFCLIGLSSLTIDATVSYLLTYQAGLNLTLAKTISFLFAVTNGFIWNNRWTFAGAGGGSPRQRYVKFLLVSCVGLVLNLSLFKGTLWVFTGRLIGQPAPDILHFAVATGVATVCVAAWNFLANKKWTFTDTA